MSFLFGTYDLKEENGKYVLQNPKFNEEDQHIEGWCDADADAVEHFLILIKKLEAKSIELNKLRNQYPELFI